MMNCALRVVAVAAGCIALTACASGMQGYGNTVVSSESEHAGWKGPSTGRPDAEVIARGRRIAQSKCAACHAIDRNSTSHKPGAPPFTDILFLNEPERVAYQLIDGIRLGHDSMPLFDMDIQAAEALVTYIRSVND